MRNEKGEMRNGSVKPDIQKQIVTEQRGWKIRKGSLRENLKREGETGCFAADSPFLLWFPLRTAPRARPNSQSD